MNFFLGESGEITPISIESEFDFNTGDATAGSIPDADVTVTEDLPDESAENDCKNGNNNSSFHFFCKDDQLTESSSYLLNRSFNYDPFKLTTKPKLHRAFSFNATQSTIPKFELPKPLEPIKIYKRQNSIPTNLETRSEKWSQKERFLISNVPEPPINTKINTPGTVLVRETYIEPLKLNRVSKSFHGKVECNQEVKVRRSSDADSFKKGSKHHSLFSENMKKSSEVVKPRFTTTIVDETDGKMDKVEDSQSISSVENRADIFATNQSVEGDVSRASSKGINIVNSENPTLTLASSLTNKPSITHGFDITDDIRN